MQAYRTRLVVKNSRITIQLPEGFENSDVEVIVVQSSLNQPVRGQRKSFAKFRGSLQTGLSQQELDEELLKMRDEWERPLS